MVGAWRHRLSGRPPDAAATRSHSAVSIGEPVEVMALAPARTVVVARCVASGSEACNAAKVEVTLSDRHALGRRGRSQGRPGRPTPDAGDLPTDVSSRESVEVGTLGAKEAERTSSPLLRFVCVHCLAHSTWMARGLRRRKGSVHQGGTVGEEAITHLCRTRQGRGRNADRPRRPQTRRSRPGSLFRQDRSASALLLRRGVDERAED